MTTLLIYFAYFKGWIFANFENISPQEAHTLLSKSTSLTIVDIRSQEEFDKDHITNAISFPLEKLSDFNVTAIKLLVYSERGELSVEASRILSEKGYEVLNLEGGVVFWIRAGYEVAP